jgi:hypothetical protein
VQLRILVDGLIDASQQPLGLKPGEMIAQIERRLEAGCSSHDVCL